ncbi:MAG: hypothetical protein JNN08_17415 [Bryobacterales bacterium]|nr:hypothetical protein [Bryobacterales bacterium]
MLALGAPSAGAALEIQQVQETDELGVALLRGNPVWKVVEKVGSERWDATWTLRSDGKTFDGHWVHQPGGNSGELSAFAKITSLRGSNIVVDRAGLGRYTGVLSADRTRITGRMSWAGGTWEVRLEGGALGGNAGGKATSGVAAPSATGRTPSSTRNPTNGAPTQRSLAGQKWRVVETSGGDRWTAEWTVRSDGRSFDATWSHSPGGDQGRLTNFARIISISGNQIRIERPGLGMYTGTIAGDRRSIRGGMSWAGGAWTVTLSETRLPDSLP